MSNAFSTEEWEAMLAFARHCIARKLGVAKMDDNRLLKNMTESRLKEKHGVFVTLQKNGRLRGCIGAIEPVKRLDACLKENALNAAFHDRRFPPVDHHELPHIDIEISILTLPEKLEYQDENELVSRLTPHRDGVIIEKDTHRATFLPQVWEQLPEPDRFLSQLCLKAGLFESAWKTDPLSVYTYQVQSFQEHTD